VYEAFGVQSLEEVEALAEEGQLQTLPGLGALSERNILEGINLLRLRQGRMPLWRALDAARRIAEGWQEGHAAIARVELTGQLRRREPEVSGLSLLAVSQEPEGALAALPQLPVLRLVRSEGDNCAEARSLEGWTVRLKAAAPSDYGTHLVLETGSEAHQVELQELAEGLGLTLDGKGLRRGDERLRFAEEAEFYTALGLPWIPPPLREGRGEVEAAHGGELPSLVQQVHIRGDLHCHTDWSDGHNTVREMAEAARELGYEYVAISDHTKSLGIANGLDEARLVEQRAEIERLNQSYSDFRILHGAEVEVKADGSLDFQDDVLAWLDVVVASLHSGLRQDAQRITERALSVLANPHLDILGHPSGRILGQREASKLDSGRVIAEAAACGVALEINANPTRLDLDDAFTHQAVGRGVKLSIATDAHSVDELNLISWGITAAQRGWAQADDIINAWELERMLAWLRNRG
jgi:DNA polymerase (family 10)